MTGPEKDRRSFPFSDLFVPGMYVLWTVLVLWIAWDYWSEPEFSEEDLERILREVDSR